MNGRIWGLVHACPIRFCIRFGPNRPRCRLLRPVQTVCDGRVGRGRSRFARIRAEPTNRIARFGSNEQTLPIGWDVTDLQSSRAQRKPTHRDNRLDPNQSTQLLGSARTTGERWLAQLETKYEIGGLVPNPVNTKVVELGPSTPTQLDRGALNSEAFPGIAADTVHLNKYSYPFCLRGAIHFKPSALTTSPPSDARAPDQNEISSNCVPRTV